MTYRGKHAKLTSERLTSKSTKGWQATNK